MKPLGEENQQVEPDPELVLESMRTEARDAARDLIPVLFEKALNGKTKDSIAVFEALADRSDFTRPTEPAGAGPSVQILNINPDQFSGMIEGLKTITHEGE